MLRIRTFGGCRVERDRTELVELSGQRKTLAFLAVLAAVGSRGITRELITAMLWPEHDETHSRRSLKQLVHTTRRQTGIADLLLPTSELRLNPARISSDATDFREARGRGDHELAVGLYVGPFLDGFYLRQAVAFERWVSETRALLARDYARSIEALATTAEKRGDTRAVVEWCRRLTLAEPLSASAAVRLMRALDAAGERTTAIGHANDFQAFISKELNSGPDPTVAAFSERLRLPSRVGVATTATPVGPAPIVDRSIVVLPFVNTSGDAADEPFSDGLTDELIGAMGRLEGLTVIGRTSAFAFKGKQLDARAIAETLHVGSVLEGSVRRSGQRLKIGVQLIRAVDGAVVWSDVYDRDTSDLFAVQAEIARAIATALQLKLSPAPTFRPATTDIVAHELYLKGRYFQNRVSATDLQRSITYFQQAIDQDSQYADAYAGLADAFLLLAILGNEPPGELVSRVHAAIARALAIDGALAAARTSLASVLFAFDWDWPAAGAEFERAIALDPRYGLAHARYGLYLMYLGRFDQAQQVLENAHTADPLSPSASMNLGRVHLCAGRANAAIPFLRTAVNLNPHLALAREQLGHAYVQARMLDKALESFQQLSALGTAFGSTRYAYGLAVAGREREARAIARELTQESNKRHVSSFGLAMVHVGLHDVDRAFFWLDRACSERDAFLHTIKTAPPFELLEADPRWEALLARIGLAK